MNSLPSPISRGSNGRRRMPERGLARPQKRPRILRIPKQAGQFRVRRLRHPSHPLPRSPSRLGSLPCRLRPSLPFNRSWVAREPPLAAREPSTLCGAPPRLRSTPAHTGSRTARTQRRCWRTVHPRTHGEDLFSHTHRPTRCALTAMRQRGSRRGESISCIAFAHSA